MAAISTAVAAIGIGISGYSVINGMQQGKKQDRATQEAYGAQERIAESNAQLSREVSGITKYQEGIRRKLVQMETTKARRNLIRQTQLARATALSRGTTMGAASGSSFQGVMSSLTSDFSSQINEIRGNLRSSMQQFDINENIVDAQNRNAQRTGVFNSQLATAQTNAASAASRGNRFQAIGQIGGSLVQNSETIGNVSQSFGGLFK